MKKVKKSYLYQTLEDENMRQDGLNIRCFAGNEAIYPELNTYYSKELDFIAVNAIRCDISKEKELCIKDMGEIVFSGRFEKTSKIDSAPDGDLCTSFIIHYNKDNLSDIITWISTVEIQARMNAIEHHLKRIESPIFKNKLKRIFAR